MNGPGDWTGWQHDHVTVATWTVLASLDGAGTEYLLCSTDGGVVHVVMHPNGPDNVLVVVSEHGDYLSALRAVVARIEEELPEGGRAAAPLDITPRLRIDRTWYTDTGPHAGKVCIWLAPLYVTPAEFAALVAAHPTITKGEPDVHTDRD